MKCHFWFAAAKLIMLLVLTSPQPSFCKEKIDFYFPRLWYHFKAPILEGIKEKSFAVLGEIVSFAFWLVMPRSTPFHDSLRTPGFLASIAQQSIKLAQIPRIPIQSWIIIYTWRGIRLIYEDHRDSSLKIQGLIVHYEKLEITYGEVAKRSGIEKGSSENRLNAFEGN